MDKNRTSIGVAVCLAVLALSGCMSHEGRTSGIIGCPVDEVKISNQQRQFQTITWQAECRGKTFYCTGDSGGGTTCAPALKAE